MEVIEGAPPAEYGGKTSLVIVVTTRSGLGATTPHGDVTASYGTFGSSNEGFDLAYGRDKWGNFISANGLNTGRFLDGPEYQVFHDHGNEENLFDRLDFKLSDLDSINLNLGFTRSWFQTPNSYDARTRRPGTASWRITAASVPMVYRSAPRISARRSERLTLRRSGLVCSIPRPYSHSAVLCGRINTTIIRAITRSPT
jgi:hypothetical protein